MKKPFQFVDPYGDMDEDDQLRIQADISAEDKRYFQSVWPVRGSLQTIFNLIFKSIVDELRSRNILYYAPENESILHEIVERRTALSPVGSSSGVDDKRRTRKGEHGGNSSLP